MAIADATKFSFINQVQINIPFAMLEESYLDLFVLHGLNPEIGFDAEALDRYVPGDFGRVAEPLRKRGLRITLHAPYMDLSPGSPDPKVWAASRNRFEQMLPLLRLFNAKTVVCHTGYDERRYRDVRDLWVEKSLEMWSWLGERIRGEGALLMLENVYERSPQDIRVLFENLSSESVRFCFDTGHQAAFSTASVETWVHTLGPFLGQLHLHDNAGNKDDHLAPGQGIVDFGSLFQEIMGLEIQGPVITLEPHREEDLLPALHFLEDIWPW